MTATADQWNEVWKQQQRDDRQRDLHTTGESIMATTEPTITVLSSDPDRHEAKLRIVGGTLAGDWTPRPGNEAWCEVSISLTGHDLDRGYVRSFGGEVWPAAWPSLFDVGPRTTHGQTTHLTDRGVEIAQAAIFGIAGAGAAYL